MANISLAGCILFKPATSSSRSAKFQNSPMMKKTELVFVPVPGRGHIASAIEFAKRLLDTDAHLSLTFLVVRQPDLTALSSYVTDLAAANPSIRFITLPHVDPPPPELMSNSLEKFASVYMEAHKSAVREALVSHVLSDPDTRLRGLVLDLFCSCMIDVADELGVPSYVYFTSSAAFLGLMLYLPVRHAHLTFEFTRSDPDSVIPAFRNPVPVTALPSFLFNTDGGYSCMVEHGVRFRQATGVIVNTFAEFEPHAVQSLTLYKSMPNIYTVGPVLNFQTEKHSEESIRIMKWLDDQPSCSVVFLCFGSMGGFEPLQLAEIASALEQAGHSFLWCVRAPPPKDSSVKPAEYSVLSEVLPEEFLKRTENRGMVCSWAPQLDVLGHKAVGGFVSHCGWNSVLESIWNGVPIATWPIYAEQQANAFELVKELEIAVEMSMDYSFVNPDKVVKASEIEKGLRLLMDPENPVRLRVKEMGEKSRKAVADGGSSSASLARFLQDVTLLKS